jgi:hypothetical protein
MSDTTALGHNAKDIKYLSGSHHTAQRIYPPLAVDIIYRSFPEHLGIMSVRRKGKEKS